MREIKFRAFVKDEGKICEVDLINWRNNFVHLVGYAYYNEDIEMAIGGRDMKDIELMQFTGLHDKNGKEIYEGDIIKQGEYGNKYNGRLGVGEYVTDNSNGVPVNGYWYRSGTDSASTIWPKESEVIGNIHQNPELLK